MVATLYATINPAPFKFDRRRGKVIHPNQVLILARASSCMGDAVGCCRRTFGLIAAKHQAQVERMPRGVCSKLTQRPRKGAQRNERQSRQRAESHRANRRRVLDSDRMGGRQSCYRIGCWLVCRTIITEKPKIRRVRFFESSTQRLDIHSRIVRQRPASSKAARSRSF